jgi:phage virion morphogenesis protein
MISIDIDDHAVIAALERLRGRTGESGLRPALALIGEHLAETTQQRFASSTAPDGSRWAPNAPSTLARLLKKGRRPLIDSGELAHTIRWQFIDGGVAVGTDRFSGLFDGGAAMHQFGSRDGRIPARPFLGISDDDRRSILAIVEAHFADQ